MYMQFHHLAMSVSILLKLYNYNLLYSTINDQIFQEKKNRRKLSRLYYIFIYWPLKLSVK